MSVESLRSIIGALLLPTALLTVAAAAQEPPLFDAPKFQAGTFPAGQLADVDGDGLLDVVTGEWNVLTTHHAMGEGVLIAGPPLRLATWSQRLPAADLDQDGDVDFVAGNYQSPIAQVVLDTGSVLTSGSTTTIGTGCFQLALADLDGDGHPDLLSAASPVHELRVVAGLGAGAFGPLEIHDVPAGAVGFDVADLNADGALDVAVASGKLNNTVSILTGLGGGALAAPRPLPVAQKPESVAAGDLDGDGLDDLVVLHDDLNVLSIRLNLGLGLFPESQALDSYASSQARITDIEGDGRNELVSSSYGGITMLVDVFGADADHQFALRAQHHMPGTGLDGVHIGDVSGDGAQDLVVAGNYYDAAGLAVLLGRPDGSWADGQAAPAGPEDVPSGPLSGVHSSQLADVDADGRPDLVAVHVGVAESRVCVRTGRGDGSFGAATLTLLPNLFGNNLRCGDLDADGTLDVVTTRQGAADQVTGLLGDGAGTFTAVGSPAALPATWTADVDLGDLDGDGDDDAVVMCVVPLRMTALLSQAGALTALPSLTPTGNAVAALGDVNADGDLDALTSASVWLGLGDGHFAAPAAVDLGDVTFDIELVDLDEDGWPDAAASSADYAAGVEGVTTTRNLGGGAFAPPVAYYAGTDPRDIEVADVDGDDRLDLLVVFDDSADIAVLPGLGHASFGDKQLYGAWDDVQTLDAADLDEDGWTDLVAGQLHEAVRVYFNHRGPWTDIGFGESAALRLGASGPLQAGTESELVLHGAAPGSKVLLVLGSELDPTPFAGGLLAPVPRELLPVLADASGEARVVISLPAATPVGLQLLAQAVAPTPDAPDARTLSNAMRGTVAP